MNKLLKELTCIHERSTHDAPLWNRIWNDMFIETTFMPYGHGPKGIIGITKPETCALGLHICSKVDKSIKNLVNEDALEEVQYIHKEEMDIVID